MQISNKRPKRVRDTDTERTALRVAPLAECAHQPESMARELLLIQVFRGTFSEGWEVAAVQKPTQPIAGKFRNHDGVHQRRDDSNEGDVKAFVHHGCFSIRFLLAAPETKHESLMK